jgi:hypothetical protein
MAKVKGTALVATLRFLEEQFGGAGLRPVLDALPPGERAMVEPAPLASVHRGDPVCRFQGDWD